VPVTLSLFHSQTFVLTVALYGNRSSILANQPTFFALNNNKLLNHGVMLESTMVLVKLKPCVTVLMLLLMVIGNVVMIAVATILIFS
jgi:hypothetical protein